MKENLNKQWRGLLSDQFKQQYWQDLESFVEGEYKTTNVFPIKDLVFNALNSTSPSDIKVVILGQDPYHGPGQAHGLCFSVPDGVKIPPSLRNIYKEISNDIGGQIPESGNLEGWAKQGVLLLNATLTVQAGKAGSHQKKGWETFTDSVIRTISGNSEHVVFLLWGNYAQSKKDLIDTKKHLVLEAPHPSPLSAHRGFLGCKHFSKTNTYLKSKGKKQIKWI